MTAPVPQAAVDALWLHQQFVEGASHVLCRCKQGGWMTRTEHREHVAAAVVAAVQGPIKAEAPVIHVVGFGTDGIKASLIEGNLADVANRTLDAVQAHGHEVQVSTVRTLDGWLREVHATVTVDPDRPMWHRFLTASDAWPMADRLEAQP